MRKSTPGVTEEAAEICSQLNSSIESIESAEDVKSTIASFGDKLANNLLARNAISRKPVDQCRVRSVFDVAYGAN